MAFNIQGGAHCCALEYDWTSFPCCYEDDGSTAIVGTRSLNGRSISKLTPPPDHWPRSCWYGLGYVQWRLILDPIVDAAGYGHVSCIDKTMALLLSLWLSCGGGAFKTF